MYTIAISLQKGGCGKSTLALALAAGLKRKGKTVLLVDLDAQCSLSETMGASTEGISIADVIKGSVKAEQAIIPADLTDIIAASPALSVNPFENQNTVELPYALKNALEPIGDRYDYCLLDCPPALGNMLINALVAADGVVLPLTADRYCLSAIDEFEETFSKVKKYINADLTLLGLVVSRYNGRSVLSRQVLEMLKDKASELNTRVLGEPIRECISVREAQMMYNPDIFAYAPKSNAAQDFNSVVDEIMRYTK